MKAPVLWIIIFCQKTFIILIFFLYCGELAQCCKTFLKAYSTIRTQKVTPCSIFIHLYTVKQKNCYWAVLWIFTKMNVNTFNAQQTIWYYASFCGNFRLATVHPLPESILPCQYKFLVDTLSVFQCGKHFRIESVKIQVHVLSHCRYSFGNINTTKNWFVVEYIIGNWKKNEFFLGIFEISPSPSFTCRNSHYHTITNVFIRK